MLTFLSVTTAYATFAVDRDDVGTLGLALNTAGLVSVSLVPANQHEACPSFCFTDSRTSYDHVYRIKDHLTTSAAALVPSQQQQQRRCEFTDKLCASFQNFFFLNKLAALLQLVQK